MYSSRARACSAKRGKYVPFFNGRAGRLIFGRLPVPLDLLREADHKRRAQWRQHQRFHHICHNHRTHSSRSRRSEGKSRKEKNEQCRPREHKINTERNIRNSDDITLQGGRTKKLRNTSEVQCGDFSNPRGGGIVDCSDRSACTREHRHSVNHLHSTRFDGSELIRRT